MEKLGIFDECYLLWFCSDCYSDLNVLNHGHFRASFQASSSFLFHQQPSPSTISSAQEHQTSHRKFPNPFWNYGPIGHFLSSVFMTDTTGVWIGLFGGDAGTGVSDVHSATGTSQKGGYVLAFSLSTPT